MQKQPLSLTLDPTMQTQDPTTHPNVPTRLVNKARTVQGTITRSGMSGLMVTWRSTTADSNWCRSL